MAVLRIWGLLIFFDVYNSKECTHSERKNQPTNKKTDKILPIILRTSQSLELRDTGIRTLVQSWLTDVYLLVKYLQMASFCLTAEVMRDDMCLSEVSTDIHP